MLSFLLPAVSSSFMNSVRERLAFFCLGWGGYAALALLVCLGMAATAQAQTAAFNTANVLNVGSSPLSSQTMSR